MTLTFRSTYPGTDKEHYTVYSGDVRLGTIYRTPARADRKEWFWGINGVLHGPLAFNGFAMTRDAAQREMADSWHKWLSAAKLAELEAPVTDEDGKPP